MPSLQVSSRGPVCLAGGVELGTNTKGERLKHWYCALKQPNKSHKKWHPLSLDVTPKKLN